MDKPKLGKMADFPAECYYCDVILENVHHLQQHFATYHSTDKNAGIKKTGTFMCTRCGNCFVYKKRMENHMVTAHASDPPPREKDDKKRKDTETEKDQPPDEQNNKTPDKSNGENDQENQRPHQKTPKSQKVLSSIMRTTMEDDIERHNTMITSILDEQKQTNEQIDLYNQEIARHTGHLTNLAKQLKYHRDMIRVVKERLEVMM